MNLLNHTTFDRLATADATPAISIYLPIEREADKHDQNRIRIKNAIANATERLTADFGKTEPEAEEMLEPAAELIADGRFSAEIDDGLAIFISPDTSMVLPLPRSFDVMTLVGSHFNLKPLLPLLSHDSTFYILALSLNEVRLLRANQASAEMVELPDSVPPSLEEAMKWEDPEDRLQWHTGAPMTGAGERPATFHGHGVTGDETQKENIWAYVRQVASGLDDFLEREGNPLILAGVEYILSIFRNHSEYAHVLDTDISGNVDDFSLQELQDASAEIMNTYMHERQQDALSQLANASGTDLFTDDVDKLVAAAHYGQIDTLFIPRGMTMRGSFDPATGVVTRSEDATSDDLLERSAVATILNSGSVYLIDNDNLPTDALAAATLRAPVTTLA